MLKEILANFGSMFCDLMSTLIFIQILMSWFVTRENRLYVFLESATSPIMNVCRKITPRSGMIDFSPVVAMIGLEILKNVWAYMISFM
jgi:YggT family protein